MPETAYAYASMSRVSEANFKTFQKSSFSLFKPSKSPPDCSLLSLFKVMLSLFSPVNEIPYLEYVQRIYAFLKERFMHAPRNERYLAPGLDASHTIPCYICPTLAYVTPSIASPSVAMHVNTKLGSGWDVKTVNVCPFCEPKMR